MFNFLKKKSKKAAEPTPPVTELGTNPPDRVEPFAHGLTKTRQRFTQGIGRFFLGKKHIDQSLLDEIETHLLTADVGVNVSQHLIEQLTQALKRQDLSNSTQLYRYLRQLMIDSLRTSPRQETPLDKKPAVYLLVGVNGAGKTTSLAKLAKRFQKAKQSVLIAAGDTYRAAAIEQLTVWSQRHNIPIISQHPGSDSASVCYDAFHAAQARQCDILLADTAGRLHTQDNLMAELQKIERVLKKLDETAPHETWLVIDASTGQNGLAQAQNFHQAIPLTGVILTKMDGTAKGGIAFAIVQALGLPICFIGLGEQADDLQPFDPEQFVDAILTPPAESAINESE